MYKISITPEEIEDMPLGNFPGEIVVIDRPGFAYTKAVAYLCMQKVIGFDTETRPVFSPGQKHNGVALLQLSGPDKAFLFRVQTLGMRKMLRAVLSNPRILKIGAASHDDVRGLQKIAPFKEKGFVDLQKMVWEWGIRDKSVKKMAAIILGCRISKSQQLSNWEAETLSVSQQKYAATDAWICREMYLKLLGSEKHPLTPEEMIPPQQLQQQMEAAAARAAKASAEGRTAEASDKPAKKRKPRHRKRKPAAAGPDAPQGAQTTAADTVQTVQSGSAEPMSGSAADAQRKPGRRRKHHRKPKSAASQGEGGSPVAIVQESTANQLNGND